jgi:putative ABC transport system permease protein
MVYGYVNLDTLALRGETPTLDQLKILVSSDRFDRAHIQVVSEEVRKRVEALGHPVRRLDVPVPGKHPHADLMGALLLAISSFGLLVLGLSGVLVVNLLTALMASQVRQIGMMKAIGGTRAQVAAIYLGQAFLLGIAAVAVALPLGMLGARALCQYLAVFLNFDIRSFAVPVWVYALVALIGLATPLIAASWPVAKGSAITVAAALADYGVSDRGFGSDALDRSLASAGGPSRTFLLAVRNSFRRRSRLGLTLVTLSISGLFYMTALNVRASMINTLDHLFAARKFDLSVVLATMYPIEQIREAIAMTPGALKSEGWIVTDAFLEDPANLADKPASASLHEGGGSGGHDEAPPPGARISVLALPPETELLKLEIDAGRDLPPGEADAIVINSAFVNRFPGVTAGKTISLRMGPAVSSWRVVGISHEAFAAPTGYVWRTYFERAGGHVGMANSVRIALTEKDADAIDRFRDALDRSFEARGLRSLAMSSKAESRYAFDEHMLMIYLFLVVMSLIIGGVGGLGLTTTMSLNVLERRREMGVLRAIGASSRRVWLIVVVEALAIGVMSFAVASILAFPMSRALGDFLGSALFQTGLSFVFDPSGLVICFAASLALSTVASFLPAWHASRSPVREALGFE